MIIAIPNALNDFELAEIRALVEDAPFSDGAATAGWAARLVKRNLQATDGPALSAAGARIEQILLAHPVFVAATRPKHLIGPMVSRYEPGHAYGAHIDNAILAGSRADVSFTVFLSHPEDYDGGELVIATHSGEEAFKLAAGSVVTYPATTLHHVSTVSRGTRIAAVGWVRSYVRAVEQRELLFDLDTALHALFEKSGKTPELDLLHKTSANLLRMWADD